LKSLLDAVRYDWTMDTSWFWERIRNLATVVGILAVLTGFVQWLVEGWSGTTAVQTLAVAGIAGMLGVAWLGVAGLRRSLSRRKELRSVRQELEDSADTIALAERSQLLGRVIRLQQADEQQRRDSLSAILFGAGLALGGLLDLRRSLEDDVIGPGVIVLAILGGLAVIWVFLWFGLRVSVLPARRR
jgi:hypothetical protein